MELVFMLVLWADERVRPKLAAVVPDLDALRADPAAHLDETGGVHIGPRKYLVAGLAVGLPVGAAVGGAILGLLAGGLADLGVLPANAVKPVWFTGAALGALAGPWTVWRLTRGGELALVPSGLVLSRRGRDVLVPWAALDLRRGWKTDGHGKGTLPLHPDQLDAVTLLVRGEPRAYGEAVRVGHFKVDRHGAFTRVFRRRKARTPLYTATVADIYAARLSEVFPLVYQVAARLR